MKLNKEQKDVLMAGLSAEPITELLIRDLLKINFLLLKELD
jgi:hypothetical protein